MIMLDTDVISRLRLRETSSLEPDGSLALRRWLAGLDTDVCIAAITLSELSFGAALKTGSDPDFAAELEGWIDGLAAQQRVLPLDARSARLLGRMQAVPAFRQLAAGASGARFGSDLGIAATAIIAGCPLATLNVRDFRLIARHFPALVVLDPLG